MTNIEKIEADEMKLQRIINNNYHCEVCNKRFGQSQLQLAHRIPKHKRYLEEWGEKIIHHRLNLVLTCDKCNSGVMLNPRDNYGKALIEEIKADIVSNK